MIDLQDEFERQIQNAGIWFESMERDGQSDYVHHTAHTAFVAWQIGRQSCH